MLSNERVDNEAIVTGSPHAGRLGQPQKGVVMNKRFLCSRPYQSLCETTGPEDIEAAFRTATTGWC